MTGVSIIIENFLFLVRKILPSFFDLGQHLTFGSKIFKDDIDASHYLYEYTDCVSGMFFFVFLALPSFSFSLYMYYSDLHCTV